MRLQWISKLLACLVVAGCGSSPSSPSDMPTSRSAGKWTGTTAQGATIAFEVSSAEILTSITMGHSFNGCSGIRTFTNLNIRTTADVTCVPGPCSESLLSYRAFAFTDGSFQSGPMTSVNGLFLLGGQAEGVVAFRELPGCGTALSVPWSATRQGQ